MEAKSLFKETKQSKYKAFDEAFKLSLNGSSFGKLGEPTNWQYDPFILYNITIGNQFEILMLVEMFEESGIHIVSANTDGVVALFDKELESTYYDICHKWEEIVGNTELGQLEFTDYRLLAQTSVNDYLAITLDDKVKKKGDFLTDFEIHKNKSRKIVGIALENYFVHGIKPEDTITNHKNIFDFCLSVKGSGNASFYSIDTKTNESIKLQKINRFYVSNSDNILIKEMPPLENKKPSYQIDIFGEVDNGERISRIEVGYNVTIFNKYVEMNNYDINYNYYISKCYEIINQINNE